MNVSQNIKNASSTFTKSILHTYTDSIILFVIANSIAITACIANGVVLYLTKKYYQFHCSPMYVRAAYALMDILASILLIIHSILRVFVNDMEAITCWIASISSGIFFSTIQMTAIIAIERYYFFCEPMKYPRYFTSRSITCLTITVIFISEAYMITTQIFIGRKTPYYYASCRLEGQSFHKTLQFLIFFLPAIVCTGFSIYKIARLIAKDRRAIAPGLPANEEIVRRNVVGRKTLRYVFDLA